MSLSQTRDTDNPERRGFTAWHWSQFAALDDGKLIRSIFFALLIGTFIVLGLDLRELLTRPPSILPDMENPVLPAVQRPGVSPVQTAPPPETKIDSTPEELRQPLEIKLLEDGVLQLKGAIGVGASVAFSEEIEARGSYVKTVTLNSPGGSVQDALTIAALIREKGYATSIGKGAYCASSCPLALAGGKERLVHEKAVVGIHQIYAAGNPGITSDQAMYDAQATTAEITRHLKDMGVSTDLWVHALETPPDRLYYLSAEEMAEYELATEIIK